MQNTKNEWKTLVKRLSSRTPWINYDRAVDIVKKLGYDKFYQRPFIVDTYCGPAVFSSALHNVLHPEKHLLLEPFVSYRKWLKQIESQTPNLFLEIDDPFRWSTYTDAYKKFDFHPPDQPRSQVHNRLLFMANLLHPQGEQLATQYINCISNQSWVERFGRVRLLLLMRSSTAEKLVAGPSEKFRHRISVQTESCVDIRVVFHTFPSSIPTGYPQRLLNPLVPDFNRNEDFPKILANSSNQNVSLLELTPKEHQVPHIDEFEYVILKLFLLKSQPLSVALNNLGPGAASDLGEQLHDLLDKTPTNLTFDDILRINDAFVKWPFKPDMLLDFFDDTQLSS